MRHVALVAGSNGIIGKALVDEISQDADWKVYSLSRHSADGCADLTDRESVRKALKNLPGITHLFYAAYLPGRDLAEEDKTNTLMLRNLLNELKKAGNPLQHVVLYQGAKVYGVHLGPVPAPFYEDSSTLTIGPNFYFSQEQELRCLSEADGFTWTILRPDVVIGNAAGNAMNIATVIGTYAALTRANGAGFRFPGPASVYDSRYAQFTDARSLARASLWAALSDRAAGEAFNYVHAPFRWRRVWEKVAAHFSLPVGEPVPFSLTEHMPLLGDAWDSMASGLVESDFLRAVNWKFGDFVFNSDFDLISDTTKIRLAGFSETQDPADVLINAIEEQIKARVIPDFRS